MERCTGYTIVMRRPVGHPGWALAQLRKTFWCVGTGTRSREICETWVNVEGLSEATIVEALLADLARAHAARLE